MAEVLDVSLDEAGDPCIVLGVDDGGRPINTWVPSNPTDQILLFILRELQTLRAALTTPTVISGELNTEGEQS